MKINKREENPVLHGEQLQLSIPKLKMKAQDRKKWKEYIDNININTHKIHMSIVHTLY